MLICYVVVPSNRKKRMRQLQKKIKTGTLNLKQDDPFELFIAATNIRYCYYNETHKILGNTYGMCVLQVGPTLTWLTGVLSCSSSSTWSILIVVISFPKDFEALTPNLLARTIETVEGGGIVVILLRTMNSLKQLYTMTMVNPSSSPSNGMSSLYCLRTMSGSQPLYE